MTLCVLYDATLAYERPDAADDIDRALAPRLASRQGVLAVIVGPDGLAEAPIDAFDDAAEPTPRTTLAEARGRLLAPSPRARSKQRLAKAKPSHRPRAKARFEPPLGAVMLKIGAAGWDHSHFLALLDRRPDLRVVAAMRAPWEIEFPEYLNPFAARAAQAGWAQASRRAHRMLALEDSLAGQGLATRLGRIPSALADTTPAMFDEDLAGAPFLLQVGPIERRANSLLMLQVWRELARAGEPPLLVLAGSRGKQIDEIAPMLEWGSSFNGRVIELDPLAPNDLRALAVHARALLAPDFAVPHAALARDICALGVPTIVSNIPEHASLQGANLRRLSPLSGPDWLHAVSDAAAAGPREPDRDVALPAWDELAIDLRTHLAQL